MPPEPADVERCPCNWDRLFVRKSVLAKGNPPFLFVGALESSQGLATNFDVLVDYGSADFDPPIIGPTFALFVAVWVASAAGSGRTYRAQYQLSPATGILPVALPTPVLLPSAWSSAEQSGGLGGLQFLIHAGGVAGVQWGLDISGFGAGAAHNLIFSAIAHGKEL